MEPQFEVDLTQTDDGFKHPVGQIIFDGIAVVQVDGTTKIPMRDGKPVPFSYKWLSKPDDDAEILKDIASKIATALSQRLVVGFVGPYDWRA